MLRRYDWMAVAIFAIGLSVIFSSCGSGSSSSSTPSLTKAQFIAQADKLCEETNKAQLAAVVKASKEAKGQSLDPTEKRKLMVTAGMVPIKEEAKKIAALGAPSGEEEAVTAIAEGIEAGAGAVAGAGTVESVGPAFKSVNQKAAKYGLKSCAQSP